jgi:hypothetical protein
MKITKDVIMDLWPVYVAGEASADTRALVDEYLRGDSSLAAMLTDDQPIAAAAPPLSPDHEARTLYRTRRRLRGIPALRLLAAVFTVLALARIVSDTTWQVSPVRAIATSIAAVLFWAAYALSVRMGWSTVFRRR